MIAGDILGIKDGSLYWMDRHGNRHARVADRVQYSDFNSNLNEVLVTYQNGEVKLTDVNGNLRSSLKVTDAIDARFEGDKILIRRRGGSIELRDRHGNIQKTF